MPALKSSGICLAITFAVAARVEAHEQSAVNTNVARAVPIIFHNPDLEQHETGVYIREHDDHVQGIAMVAGEAKAVLSAPDRDSLKDRLNAVLDRKMQELQSRFGIKISRDAEVNETSTGQKVRSREPKLSELFALEYALEHSSPSFLPRNKSKKQLKVAFLKDWNCYGALANWTLDPSGNPVIFVEPEYKSQCSLESTLMHELSHHSQYRLGLDPANFAKWDLAAELGWRHFKNPFTGENGWCVKTKDGKLYKFSNCLGLWIRCNDHGQPVADDGTRVRKQIEAENLTNERLAAIAVIRPATSYFTTPAEVLAEGMMLLRMNERTRKYLRHMSPELFEIVQALDQKEIDQTFGTGRMFRSASGVLVSRTALAQALE